MQLMDLSHEVGDGTVTYPGLPAPRITDYLSREASRERYRGEAEFHIAKIEMIANTGTYLDAPSHRYEDGDDIAQLALAKVAFLPGVIVHLPEGQRALRPEHLTGLDLRGCALLVHTGWSRHWETEAYARADHPYISREAAEALVDAGAALAGIDSINVDDVADASRPAHTILLRHGIPIVEHLTNLAALRDRKFTFFAVPPRMRGVGTFIVRAFAALD